jgi:predicted aconitase
LPYVQEQTREICLAAVSNNGMALAYVHEQTPEICLAAIQKCGRALRYVREQTYEIIEAAVKQDKNAIIYADARVIREHERTNNIDNLIAIIRALSTEDRMHVMSAVFD